MIDRLTRAELAAYPDGEISESRGTEPPRGRRPAAPLRRCIDLRRFPGRTRTERVMLYLATTLPRAGSWSEASLRQMAAKLVRDAEIIE